MEMKWVRPVVWGFRSILHFIIVILNIPYYYIRIAETK